VSDYPFYIAVEAVDEFSAIWCQAVNMRNKEKRTQAMNGCCQVLALKYGTMEEGSAAHVLMTRVDQKVTSEYSETTIQLFEKIEELKQNMADNIDQALSKGEKLENVLELTNKALERCKLFKKRAQQLRWSMFIRNNRGVIVGTTICTVAGGAVGFFLGGPLGAGVLTFMESAMLAQAIEASACAALFGGTALVGAKSAEKMWFWNQKFVPMKHDD
jgi:hypothetical protein